MASVDEVTAPERISNYEEIYVYQNSKDSFSVKCSALLSNQERKILELILLQTEIDEDSRSPEKNFYNAISPLIVILKEYNCSIVQENIYYFTRESHSLGHGIRSYEKDDTDYSQLPFTYDKDISQLQFRGKNIAEMLEEAELYPALEKNPIIKKMRSNSLD